MSDTSNKQPAAPAAAAAPSPMNPKLMVLMVLGAANLAATGFVVTRVIKTPKLSLGSSIANAAEPRAAAAAEKSGAAEKDGDKSKEAGNDKEAAKDKEPGKEGGGGEPGKAASTGPGPTLSLEPFLVNLSEQGSVRYVKVSIEVEVTDAAAGEELKHVMRGVRDDLLRYLSSLSVADTMGEAGKSKIEKQMMSRIDAEMGGKSRVRRIFFTEFVVQ